MQIKRLIKFISAIVIVWVIIVVAGLFFSRSMQDKIIDIITEQANKYITSEIHIRKSDIHFSVFQKFPLASIELKNICVKIPPTVNLKESIPIKGDTLLFAGKIYLQFNLLSLLSNKYELKKISVEDGFLQILADNKGNSSLNILRKSTTGEEKEISAKIKAFSVSNLVVFTSDIKKHSRATVYIDKANASGEFYTENFSVKIKSDGVLKNFNAKNQKLEPNQNFSFDVALEYNNTIYSIRKGTCKISNIPFKIIGSIRTGDNMLIDLIFTANRVPVRQIDNALLKGLLGNNGIELRGGLIDIQSTLIGYTQKALPAIKANYKFVNGKIYDSKHNLLLEDIYLVGNADNGNEHLPKSTTIRVDTFSLRLGKSEQHGKLKLQNLIDPQLAVYSSGKLYYNDIKDWVTIKNIAVKNGEFNNQIAFAADINKNVLPGNSILQNITARGKINIVQLEVEFPGFSFPPSIIKGDVELIDNELLKLRDFLFVSGKTDISLNGTLTNFTGKGLIPLYQGDISSNVFQADEFFGVNSTTSKKTDPILFPDSIRVKGNLNIGTFKYGKFETTNASGNVDYKNKTITITGFKMDGFEGNVTGVAGLNQNSDGNIMLYTDSKLSEVDVKKLFFACNNFEQDFIGYQHLDGHLSGHVVLNTAWTNTLEFIPLSVILQSDITLTKGRIKDYEPLLGLSKFIKVDELKDIKFENFNAIITIHDKQVFLDQTRVVSSALSFDCSGIHDFDNKYEYRLQLALSDFLWKKTKSKNTEITEFGYVVDDNTEQTIVPVIISGIGSTFDVKYDKKTARNRFKEKVENEKLILKDLFSGNEISNQIRQNESLPDKEEEIPAKLEKIDSAKYRTQSNEFILEWDDSEDDGKGNDY